jgi:hypothetical protein
MFNPAGFASNTRFTLELSVGPPFGHRPISPPLRRRTLTIIKQHIEQQNRPG